jgi:integrase
MPSVSNDRNGRWRVGFVGGDGRRYTVRLGQCARRDAEAVARRIAELNTAASLGQPIARDTAEWVGRIGDVLHDRLARVHLVEPRRAVVSHPLGQWCADYIAAATSQPQTRANLRIVAAKLRAHFGADRAVETITAADAAEWRRWMEKDGMAPATVNRYTGRARQIFAGVGSANPFAGLSGGSVVDVTRQYFVTRAQVDAVFAKCPNATWRLLVALCRYGGLRCPSETAGLRWADIDFDRVRFTVRSPKTAHQGKPSRVVPIFPELRPHLLAARAAAPADAEWACRPADADLRGKFGTIIDAASLKRWPKRFHNLRASRQTELVEQFPSHVVCQWLGNSPAIAARHYLQTTEAHFNKASAQIPARSMHPDGAPCSAEPAMAPEKRGIDPEAVPDCNPIPVKGQSTRHNRSAALGRAGAPDPAQLRAAIAEMMAAWIELTQNQETTHGQRNRPETSRRSSGEVPPALPGRRHRQKP